MAFVENLDLSVEQIVNSEQFDLFQPLPKEISQLWIDLLATTGLGNAENSSDFLTNNYGFITDYG